VLLSANTYDTGRLNLPFVGIAHPVAGIDRVEVAPDYDRDGTTAIPAAQVLLNLPGFVFHARSARA